MQLEREELAELAGFLARRFPEPEDVAALGRAVGVEASDAGSARDRWGALLLGVEAQGRLLDLARAAQARAPEDGNLKELLRTLEADRAADRRPMALLMVVALAFVIGGVAWQLTRPAPPPPPEPPRGIELTGGFDAIEAIAEAPATSTSSEGGGAAAGAETEPAAVPVEGAGLDAEPAAEAVTDAEPPAEPASATEPASTAEPTPAAPSASIAGRCGGPSRDVIGYWYAGAPFEARAGQTYTLKYGVNVRADYPRRANDWDAKSKVVCSLRGGDALRLSLDPILVDGGRYWVPFTPADLLSR